MKTYTYIFPDGTKSEVEVTDETYERLMRMDEDERKQNYNYKRHNVSLSAFTYDGEDFADKDIDLIEKVIKNEDEERVRIAISTLTEKQRELVNSVYYERISVVEIAKQQGVDKSAISHRLERIKEKLKKILI